MNWQTAFNAIESITRGAADAATATATLQREVETTTQINADDKAEITLVLEKLITANLYGKIALVGQLKKVLSKHPAFTARYAEYGHLRR